MSESLGTMLKRHRLSVGLSQTDLAYIARCDATYIGLLERDARAPSRGTVLAIGSALGLTTSQTDRLLRAAGFASQVDYQELWESKYGPAEDRTKWCPRCRSVLSVALFPKDRCQGDGLNAQCRACKAEIQRQYQTRRILRGQERRAG